MLEPPGTVSVMVPTPSWLGSALHCAVADNVPALSKLNCEASEFATSCCPLPVKTEIWLSLFCTTRTFMSCDSWVTSWPR